MCVDLQMKVLCFPDYLNLALPYTLKPSYIDLVKCNTCINTHPQQSSKLVFVPKVSISSIYQFLLTVNLVQLVLAIFNQASIEYKKAQTEHIYIIQYSSAKNLKPKSLT